MIGTYYGGNFHAEAIGDYVIDWEFQFPVGSHCTNAEVFNPEGELILSYTNMTNEQIHDLLNTVTRLAIGM